MSTPAQVSSSTEIVAKERQQQLNDTTLINRVPETVSDCITIAKMMAASELCPDARSVQRAAGLIGLGASCGLTAMESLSGMIMVVNGRTMLHYQMILAKIDEHPHYDYKIIEDSPERAEVEFYRGGELRGTSEFTIAQARKAGTKNLDKIPEIMLLARAIGRGARKYCPGLMGKAVVYAQGEITEDDRTPIGGSKANRLRQEFAVHNAGQPAQSAAADESIIDAETVEDLAAAAQGSDTYIGEDGFTYNAKTGALLDEPQKPVNGQEPLL